MSRLRVASISRTGGWSATPSLPGASACLCRLLSGPSDTIKESEIMSTR